MKQFWMNFALEIGILSGLGIIYYFYQKKKLLHFEENKNQMVMTFLLNSCLSEKNDSSQPELDLLIEALDDFVNLKNSMIPVSQLESFSTCSECSEELRALILEALGELKNDKR
jgi:hypothetical protein